MPAAKNSDVVEHARRLWLTLPHEERAVRKLAARLREQGIKVGKSTIAEWVRKWDEGCAVAQTLPDQLVSAIANGQSLAAVEQSLAVAAAEVTRRLRAGGRYQGSDPLRRSVRGGLSRPRGGGSASHRNRPARRAESG
jgi:hypothetical protein